MICFRDMTFCRAKCKNTDCDRLLTPKVELEAVAWWGKDSPAPIAVSDFHERCDIYIPEDDDETAAETAAE